MERFGALSAKQCVKRLFPKPASQRWGRVHELEERLIQAGFLNIALCIAEILTTKFVDLAEVASLETVSANDGDASWAALTTVQSLVKSSKGQQVKNKQKVEESITKTQTPDLLSVQQTRDYTIQMSKWRGKDIGCSF